MVQIHKRFTDEQVRMLFGSYNQGQISRTDVQGMLGIGRARFFVLLKDYRQDPQPLRVYVDSLRVFRFVQGRDSFWRKHVLETDDVDTQLSQMMRLLGVEVVHALSPQAKGKVERPYCWLQDRIVRPYVYENLSALEDVREVLKAEVKRYNNRQVHSITDEIPNLRFQQAKKEGNSLFRKFTVPKPYRSPQDIFCLRITRIVNCYRRILDGRSANRILSF